MKIKKYKNKKTNEWTKEYTQAVKEYQEKLKKIPQILLLRWKEDKSLPEGGKVIEIDTFEYRKLKESFRAKLV